VARAIPTGKLPPALLAELLAAGPPLPSEVRLGPKVGEDACAIDVPAGTLVAGTDPITLTGQDIGAHAVVVNANDVAVMGVRPRWFLAAVLLPAGTRERDVRALFAAMRKALSACGAALVGGHTEVTQAVAQPVIVGQMLGLAETGRIVMTGGVRAGDAVVQVGSAPVEGAAVLAREAGTRLGGVRRASRAAALRALEDPGISVVEPALACAALGATALHDPTEGGLAAGLVELADASGVALEVESDAIAWFEPGLEICAAVGADPWGTLASGSLLAAFPAGAAARACAALAARGFRAGPIGRAHAGAGVRRDGRPLEAPARDEVARVLEQPRPRKSGQARKRSRSPGSGSRQASRRPNTR
jgi:hydrogenase maturation factor